MRRKVILSGLGLALAVFGLTGFGSSGSTQALDCPAGQLEPVCGAVNLVVGTACVAPIEAPGTFGPVTIDVEGGPPVQCPDI